MLAARPDRRTARRAPAALSLGVVVVLLAGCSGQDEAPITSPTASVEPSAPAEPSAPSDGDAAGAMVVEPLEGLPGAELHEVGSFVVEVPEGWTVDAQDVAGGVAVTSVVSPEGGPSVILSLGEVPAGSDPSVHLEAAMNGLAGSIPSSDAGETVEVEWPGHDDVVGRVLTFEEPTSGASLETISVATMNAAGDELVVVAVVGTAGEVESSAAYEVFRTFRPAA